MAQQYSFENNVIALIIQSLEGFELDQHAFEELESINKSDVYEKRILLRERTGTLCDKLNSTFSKEILVPFRTDRSSEIQVVLSNKVIVPSILELLNKEFGSMFVGIGQDKLSIYDSNDVDICDGPAFWKAREMIEEQKSQYIQQESSQTND